VEFFQGKYYVTYHTSAQVVPTNSSARFFRIDEVGIDWAMEGRIALDNMMTSSGMNGPFKAGERIQAASLIGAPAMFPSIFVRGDDADASVYEPYPYIRISPANEWNTVEYRQVSLDGNEESVTLRIRTQSEGMSVELNMALEDMYGVLMRPIALPNTGGEWQEVTFDLDEIRLEFGTVHLTVSKTSDDADPVDIDWFMFNKPKATFLDIHTASRISMKVGGELRMATSTDGVGYEYVSSNPSVARVSADGVVKAVRAGTAVISVRMTDGSGLVSAAVVSIRM
jgi:hypothetical protein